MHLLRADLPFDRLRANGEGVSPLEQDVRQGIESAKVRNPFVLSLSKHNLARRTGILASTPATLTTPCISLLRDALSRTGLLYPSGATRADETRLH